MPAFEVTLLSLPTFGFNLDNKECLILKNANVGTMSFNTMKKRA